LSGHRGIIGSVLRRTERNLLGSVEGYQSKSGSFLEMVGKVSLRKAKGKSTAVNLTRNYRIQG